MYTSLIGKKFLAQYNKKNKTNLSAKQYFETVLFPLFYDNEKFLQSPVNTPLFQLIAQKKTHDSIARIKMKNKIASKISEFTTSDEKFPEMSFAIGYPSADLLGTTSGQVTTMSLPLGEEDMFASWIGAGFGIGLQGGLNILVDHYKVLTSIEEGWKVYRQYVNENDGIDNKIESWNSTWLIHRFSDDWNPNYPRANFQPLAISKKGILMIERSSWIQILFALARKIPNERLIIYVYSLGQMNKTIGFIRLELPDITRLSEFYQALFGQQTGLTNKKLAQLYETEFSFISACERFSTIGLRAIEPKDLKKYMPGYSDKSLPTLKSDENSLINYSIYITWIIAMLNNKELLDLAEKSANALKIFLSGERQARTIRKNAIEEFLNSKNRKDFIDRLTTIIEQDPSIREIANELVNNIMLNIAPDNVPLFVTLLRFKYLSNVK